LWEKEGDMPRCFDPKRSWFKSAAVLTAYVFLVTGNLSAAPKSLSAEPRDDLVPPLRCAPIVKIHSSENGIVLEGAPEQLSGSLKDFRDGYGFKYVSALIYDALALGISARGLEYFLRDNLDGITPDGFDLTAVKKVNYSYLIPYRMPSADDRIVLLYSLPDGPAEEGWRGLRDDGGISNETDPGPVGALPDADEAVSKVEERMFPEKVGEPAGDVKAGAVDGNDLSPGRRTHIDSDTLLKTLFFSLLYLCWNMPPPVCFFKVCSELLLVFVVAMLAHQAIYLLQILAAGENARFKGVKLGLNGIGIEYSVESQSLSRSIVTAAMAGSAAIGTVFTVLSFFYESGFFVLMAIVNASFAFSSTDIEELRRDADFKNAPKMIHKKIRKALGDLLRKRYKPLIVLIGGHFASGKSIIASKTRAYLKQRTTRDVFVVGGDNWLLSDDRRDSREDRIYPYSKYEIERWEEMVRRASDGLPLYIPFYLSTFRKRLALPPYELERIIRSSEVFREDGYDLLEVDGLKKRRVADLLPPDYVNRIFRGIDSNWAHDDRAREHIRKRLRIVLERPLRRYMINPASSSLYVDGHTGDIIERLPVKPKDILIMEFEQAVSFPEINDLADVRAFVDASFLHRKEYFMERRRNGERYADLTPELTAHRMLGLLETEAGLSEKKMNADLVISNNERLEEVVMQNMEVVPAETEETYEERGPAVSFCRDGPQGLSPGLKASVENTVTDLLDAIRTEAYAASREDRKVLIGIDTSWVPELQRGMLQGLFNEMVRSSKKTGILDRVIIVSGRGEALRRRIDTVFSDHDDIYPVNMVLIGSGALLEKTMFDIFRGSSGTGGAFFAEIHVPPDFPDAGFVDVPEMIASVLRKAFTSESRRYRFTLKASPLSYIMRKELYDLQTHFLHAA
jgi:uridine kinase